MEALLNIPMVLKLDNYFEEAFIMFISMKGPFIMISMKGAFIVISMKGA